MEVIKYNHQSVSNYSTQKGRTSCLKETTMYLEGHKSEIYCGKFSGDGEYIASAGFERVVNLWQINEDCEIFATLRGHKGPILDMKISRDGNYIYTASTDKSIGVWDATKFTLIRKHRNHTNIVNTCDISSNHPIVMCSGSDDGTIKIWDYRTRDPQMTLENKYQITSIAFNNIATKIYSGGIDNDLHVWDVRSKAKSMSLKGHTDTVCGMELSPSGDKLVTSSFDNTVRIWNIQAYFKGNRNTSILYGVNNNFEHNLYHVSWSPCETYVASGSGDSFAYVWNTESKQLIYRLTGHKGAVNEADFHPKEPIIATVSTDKSILMGEINLL
ncbi:U5 small nuclear ribonucleoprotein [Intoshia linei]|uniref:U5 small nuclear ribonucleoprotein n=1 Tax=Intoshia linei TaxID=1819745 RepID=A0A177B2Y9_9BILA|nr:U5 small nuclear ribonucleoprotein [Intoshia linei]